MENILKNTKLTDFAKRHFDKDFIGTKITDTSIEQFEHYLNVALSYGKINVIDGYAPFCKLIPIENFTDAKVGTLEITLDNYQYLRSGYSARRDSELPVFSRWFELPISAPKAEYLMLVLYSKEQLDKEAELEDGGLDEVNEFPAEYGIVAILGQNYPFEEPMKPETMIRNALGISEGGSGVPLNREKYLKSVEFWSKYATVK